MNQKGMSLLEVTIAIALLSITLGVVTCNIHWVERLQLDTTVQQLQMAIKECQLNAHLKNKPYNLRVIGDTLYVVEGYTVVDKIKLPDKVGVKIVSNSKPKGKIEFRSDLSPTYCGTIYLTIKNQPIQKRVTVRPVTGLVTVYDN